MPPGPTIDRLKPPASDRSSSRSRPEIGKCTQVISPRVFEYEELAIDRSVAPLLAASQVVALRGLVLRVNEEEVDVAALENSAALAAWVMWLTKTKVVRLKLVSRETFSRLIDELGIT